MMVKFLLWCILLVLCWPLALLAVSDRLAHFAAVPDSGDRGRWRVRLATRNFVLAGKDIARAAKCLSDAEWRADPNHKEIVQAWAGRQFAGQFRFFFARAAEVKELRKVKPS
jgi:hypothetical protein